MARLASQAGSVRIGILAGGAGILALMVIGAGSCAYVVFRSIRMSTPYQMAVEEVRRSPAGRETLGEPIAEGLLTTGTVGVTAGKAKIAIPVSGPRGDGKLHVEAVEKGGEWTLTVLQLDPPGGDRIDLLPGAEQAARERGCAAGSAAHCNTLGILLSSTKGVWRPSRTEQEAAAANRWFGKACDLGSADGCLNLGVAYENGWGVGKDLARAIALYEGACGRRHAEACGSLGTLYMGEPGVAEDAPRAASLLERGCAGGAAFACSNLGLMYERGQGVAEDLPRSAALYKQGCDGGYPLGCSNLAELHVHGVGVPRDDARAAALFERACKAGDAHGCQRLSEVKGSMRVPK